MANPSSKTGFEFAMIENFDREKYAHYASLSPSERKSLPATNLWRERCGMPLIEVPEQDNYYAHYYRASSQVTSVNEKKRPTESGNAVGQGC